MAMSDKDIEELRAMGADDEDIEMVSAVIVKKMPTKGHSRAMYEIDPHVITKLSRILTPTSVHFRKRAGLDYAPFVYVVVKQIRALVIKKRGAGDKDWTRGSKLSLEARALRMLMYLKNMPEIVIAETFDQHPTTCRRDIAKMLKMTRAALSNWIYMPHRDSAEYNTVRGTGVFSGGAYDHVCYAGDMTHVKIYNPRTLGADQFDYYNVHYKCHCVLFSTLCDGAGKTRYIAGPFKGNTSDTAAVRTAGLTDILKTCVPLVFI